MVMSAEIYDSSLNGLGLQGPKDHLAPTTSIIDMNLYDLHLAEGEENNILYF